MKPTEFARSIIDRAALTPDIIAAARTASLADMSPLQLSEREVNAYDLGRLVRAALNRRPQSAIYELGISAEATKACGMTPVGDWVPFQALQRDFSATTTVGSPKLLDRTVDVATPALPLRQLGVPVVAGFHENFSIPRFATAPTPTVIAENASAGVGTATTAAIDFAPKRLSVTFETSRQAMLQSGATNILVRQINRKLFELAESQALTGTGLTVYLTGISAATDVNEVVGGVDGATLTYAHLVEMEKLAAGTGEGLTGFAINPSTRKFCRTLAQVSGTEVAWRDTPTPLLGHPVATSTLLPSTLAKGTSGSVCSALFYSSDWTQALMAIFGPGIDLCIDVFTQAPAGKIVITASLYCDFRLLVPTAFSRMVDAKLS